MCAGYIEYNACVSKVLAYIRRLEFYIGSADMKISRSLRAMFIVGSLAACHPADGDNSAVIDEVAPVSFAGTYTLGGDCAAREGTLSISETSVRLTETICNIGAIKGLNTSSTLYSLTGCRSDGGDEANRKMTISEVEDGMVEVSGWSNRDFMFETCG